MLEASLTSLEMFREYVYIPLGGNRKGKTRTWFNIFLVWFLTGLWHGASLNFICWGPYQNTQKSQNRFETYKIKVQAMLLLLSQV